MSDIRYFARLKPYDGKKYTYESYTLSEHLKFVAGGDWLEVPKAVAEKLEGVVGRNAFDLPAFEISTRFPQKGNVITLQQLVARSNNQSEGTARAKSALEAAGLKKGDVGAIGDSATSKKQMLEKSIDRSVEALASALANAAPAAPVDLAADAAPVVKAEKPAKAAKPKTEKLAKAAKE